MDGLSVIGEFWDDMLPIQPFKPVIDAPFYGDGSNGFIAGEPLQLFEQGDFNDVVGQRDWVKAWYQTDGYTGVAVDYQTAVGNVFSGSNQWAHCYEFNAEDVQGQLTTTFETAKICAVTHSN